MSSSLSVVKSSSGSSLACRLLPELFGDIEAPDGPAFAAPTKIYALRPSSDDYPRRGTATITTSPESFKRPIVISLPPCSTDGCRKLGKWQQDSSRLSTDP